MSHKRFTKSALLIALFALIFLASVPTAAALEGRGDDVVVIEAGEVIEDDLYVGANRLVLDGTVQGDLYVAGATIEINGLVTGDLIVAAQSLILNGTVEDDVRFAGAVMLLGEEAVVKDDLLVGGYSLETKVGSLVEQDVFFAGAQAQLAGNVGQDATLFTAGLALLGEIGGDVVAEVGTADDLLPLQPYAFVPNTPTLPTMAGGLTTGSATRVGGDFNVTTPVALTIPADMVDGEIAEQVQPIVAEGAGVETAVLSGNWFLIQLRRFVTLLLVGALLVWLAPVWSKQLGDNVQKRPLPSLGWGLLTLIGVAVALLLILAVTIILASIFNGLTLSGLAGVIVFVGLVTIIVLAALVGLVIAYVTTTAISFMAGRLILTTLNPAWQAQRAIAFVIGLLLFVTLTAIPFIGGWVQFAVILLGLGALWLMTQDAYRKRQGMVLPTGEIKSTVQPKTA